MVAYAAGGKRMWFRGSFDNASVSFAAGWCKSLGTSLSSNAAAQLICRIRLLVHRLATCSLHMPACLGEVVQCTNVTHANGEIAHLNVPSIYTVLLERACSTCTLCSISSARCRSRDATAKAYPLLGNAWFWLCAPFHLALNQKVPKCLQAAGTPLHPLPAGTSSGFCPLQGK